MFIFFVPGTRFSKKVVLYAKRHQSSTVLLLSLSTGDFYFTSNIFWVD